MARYDKYDNISGGFRAPLNADWLDADVAVPIGVGLDGSGKVVKGASVTGVKGVLVVDAKGKVAGDIVDVMTDGEITDLTSLTAGTNYYAAASGALGTTNTDVYVGVTVEATRMVVRVAR